MTMQHIHDNKPPISSGLASLFIDLIIWRPNQKDSGPLVRFLEQTGLGERSQTVEWLNKFTVRLSMWKGKYWYNMSPEEWQSASQDLIKFIQLVKNQYHPKRIEYDTRSFSVGLAKKVRHERKPLSKLADGQPAHDQPVWWTLSE